MTELLYPQDRTGFAGLLECVRENVHTDRRLPDWPFVSESGNVDICQYYHAITGSFEPILRSLVEAHQDEMVTLVTLDPTPQYYRSSYGSFPVFRIHGNGIEQKYWEVVSYEPSGDPAGSVIDTANVVALSGSSGRWAVWGERSWDLALVHTQVVDGPWIHHEVPFVSPEEALENFTEPDFKRPLTTEQRTAFLRNVRDRGTI